MHSAFGAKQKRRHLGPGGGCVEEVEELGFVTNTVSTSGCGQAISEHAPAECQWGAKSCGFLSGSLGSGWGMCHDSDQSSTGPGTPAHGTQVGRWQPIGPPTLTWSISDVSWIVSGLLI